MAIKAPNPLRLAIGLDQRTLFFRAPGFAQVPDGLFIDGEKAHGCTVLGCHIGNRTAVGQTEISRAIAIKLHEFSDHAFLAQQTGNGQRQIRRGNTGRQNTREFKPDDFGCQNRNRLPQHRGLGLNSAHAPSKHAHTIDRRGMTVRADERVWISNLLLVRRHATGQILHVDLMADSKTGRQHAQFLKGSLTPF